MSPGAYERQRATPGLGSYRLVRDRVERLQNCGAVIAENGPRKNRACEFEAAVGLRE